MRKEHLLTIAAALVLSLAGPAGAAEWADTLAVDSLFSFAERAVDNRNWKFAEEALEEWFDRDVEPTARAWVMLGRAKLYLDDTGDARDAFEEALDKDRNNLDALEGLCETHLIRDDEGDMKKALEKLEKAAPGSRALRYYRALAVDRFEWEEDYGETFFWDTLEQLMREEPGDNKVLSVLCDAYINDRFLERGILFLTEMQDLHGELPSLLFQLARIYTHTGDDQLATAMFRKIEVAGLDMLTPRQRFLMSQELFALEENTLACEAYFSAARDMDDALAREVFTDLRDLTTSDQRREFEYTPSGRKGIWLISFWGRKDPTPTTLKNERLVEHYRRVRHVRKEYYSPLRPGYDERGRIYIKHGEPDQTIGLHGNWAVRENISWLYSRNRSVPLIYHFVERNNYYRMVYRLEEALVTDIQSEMNMGGRNLEDLYRSRAEIDPKYDQLANAIHNFQGGDIEYARRTTLQDLFHDEEMLTERGFTEGEITETFEYEFEEDPMNFYYYPAALRSGSDTTTALGVYFALPTDQVKVPDPFGTVEIPVELEVVLYDRWWQEQARVTRQKTYRVPNFISSRETMIPDLLALEVKPGNYHMAARIKQTRSNLMQIYKSNFYVDSYSAGDTLEVSDLILASNIVEDSRPGKFNLRGHHIAPMPSAAFKQNMPIYIYYELYNLEPGDDGLKHVKVEYVVSSTGGDLGVAQKIISTLGRLIGVRNEVGKVISTFDHEIERQGDIDPVYISIDPSGYLPGSYNLMVTATDSISGQMASKDVTFMIQK